MYYSNQMKPSGFYGQSTPGFPMAYPQSQQPQDQCATNAENSYPQPGQNIQTYYNDSYYSQQYPQNFPPSTTNKISIHVPQNSTYVKPTGKNIINNLLLLIDII